MKISKLVQHIDTYLSSQAKSKSLQEMKTQKWEGDRMSQLMSNNDVEW